MASRSDAAATADAPADSVATTLSNAEFVRLRCSPDGDGLAAAGLLARGLRRVDVPFQVRVASLGGDPPVVDDGLSACVGSTRPGADVTIAPDDEPAGLAAYRIATDLGDAADPVIALAGAVAAGTDPETAGSLVDAAEASGRLTRRPGVASPVDDLVEWLAHTTLLHTSVSGDRDAAAAALSLPEGEGDDDAPPRAADAVERALRPYATPEGPVETLAGFADVLTAVARERPGTGIALVLGHGGRDAAVAAWRDHGAAVHRALRAAPTERHDGVFVVRTTDAADVADSPGRLATLARLARDFRSPEPLVVAVGDGIVAVAARESGAADAAATLAAAFPAADGTWIGGATGAVARIDPDAPVPEIVAAVREGMR